MACLVGGMGVEYSVLRYDVNTRTSCTKRHLGLPESAHIDVCRYGGTHAL